MDPTTKNEYKGTVAPTSATVASKPEYIPGKKLAHFDKIYYRNLSNEQLLAIIKLNNLSMPPPKKRKKTNYINTIYEKINTNLKVPSDPELNFPIDYIESTDKSKHTEPSPKQALPEPLPVPRRLQSDEVKTYKSAITSGTPIHITEITPAKLNKALLIQENIVKIKTNLIKVLSWKSEKYKVQQYRLQLELDDIIDQINQMGLDLDNSDNRQEIRETFPLYSTLTTSLLQIKQKIEKLDEYMLTLQQKDSETLLKNKFIDAVNNTDKGILSLTGDARESIRKGLAGQLYSLINGPEAFINNFLNMIIMGPAGTGKTRVAGVFAYVYSKCGLLSTQKVTIVTRADLIAGYVGQTAAKVRTQLLNSMEGILFIDEAYQITPCGETKSSGEDFGPEAITEIVNFLDKYVGLSIIIAAGYENEMKKCFLGANEGMPRRFPNMFLLQKYSPSDLFLIFERFILEKFGKNILSDSDRRLCYSLIDDLNVDNKFNNQAGDMQNLATFVSRRLISSESPISTVNNQSAIMAGFQDFLQIKSI